MNATSANVSTSLSRLLTPTCILPTQTTANTPDTPERRLVIAVLADAIGCIQRGGRRLRGHKGLTGTPIQVAAIRWMRSDSTAWPFAFVPICDVLGLSPAAIRRAVLAPLEHDSV